MKKGALFLGMLGLLVFSSCTSTPVDTSPIDRGSFPDDFSGAPSVTLNIHENVRVLSLDSIPVSWENTDQRQQFVVIEPGLRVFEVRYNDSILQSTASVFITAKLGDGSYLLKAITDEEKNVIFVIVTYANEVEGEEVTFSLR